MSPIILLFVFVASLSCCFGAPVSSNRESSVDMPAEMPLFIQLKYRQLRANCYDQTQSESCRLLYVIPARKCLTLEKLPNAERLAMSCSFTFDSINAEQLFIVWTKISNTLRGKNVQALQPDLLQPSFQDSSFQVFVVNKVSSEMFSDKGIHDRAFVANFSLESDVEAGPISSPENLPFIFFFSKLKLEKLDLVSDDISAKAQKFGRRGVDVAGALQPPCKRTATKVPVKWLLDEEQRDRTLFVYPAEADVGTCSATALKNGLDLCRLGNKEWTRAYDMFRISLRHEHESKPSNNELGEMRRLLGEPSCVPAALSDFEYVLTELHQENKPLRYRIVTISKFIVSKCACF